MGKNNFVVRETIRDGHLTRVVKAEQPSLKRTVLLKTLHKHLVADENLVRRFEREARACAMIRSEHIVQVYDLTDLDGAPTIVMEYVEGRSLQDVLLEGPQSERFARMVAAGVLRALAVAHKAGVVHRDIKPANIMIDTLGVVKVADFGLASVGVETTLTLEGTVLGTPAYMSPEQVSGGVVDGQSDLFSLGVTLVELVTGERLFQGQSYAECLNKILNFKVESIDRFSGVVSDQFLMFVRRLLMPGKGDRWSSAEEALKELTGEEPHRANMFAGRQIKLRRLWVSGGLAFVVLLIAAFVFFWPEADKGQERGDSTSSPQDKDSLNVVRHNSPSTRGTLGEAAADEGKQKAIVQIPPEATSRKDRSGTKEKTESPEKPRMLAVADSGFVQISCTPWAKVYVDDDYIGTTPIAGTLRLRAGTHTVTFNNPAFLPMVRSVNVEPGRQTSVEVSFLEQVGYLLVVSQPWAEIYVDDQYRETTPLGQPLMVTSGNRKVRLHNPAFEDIVTSVSVGVRDTVKLIKSFNKK